MRAHLALLLALSAADAVTASGGSTPKLHTLFCAECSRNFDYKSIGVYYSHRISGMPGNITRLLACSEEVP